MVECELLGADRAIGPGGAVVLVGQTEHTRLGASAVAQRGMRAEELGAAAGGFLRQEIISGATLDVHATDQVLIYLALAGRLPVSNQIILIPWPHNGVAARAVSPGSLPGSPDRAIDLCYGRARVRLTECIQAAASIIEETSLPFRLAALSSSPHGFAPGRARTDEFSG